MSTVRYANIDFPGALFPESTSEKVSQKTTAQDIFKKHKNAYRVHFYTRTEKNENGEKLTGKATYEKKYYLIGKAFTLEELRAHRPKLDAILISNVECNKWDGAVRCRPGNWQPLEKDTIVVPG
jgi:lactate dehydrogenase-like 2-hydroxyacid dehydrogenase